MFVVLLAACESYTPPGDKGPRSERWVLYDCICDVEYENTTAYFDYPNTEVTACYSEKDNAPRELLDLLEDQLYDYGYYDITADCACVNTDEECDEGDEGVVTTG